MAATILNAGSGAAAHTEGATTNIFDSLFESGVPDTGYLELVFTVSNIAAGDTLTVGGLTIDLNAASVTGTGSNGLTAAVSGSTVTLTWSGTGISNSVLDSVMEGMAYTSSNDDLTAANTTRVFDITSVTDATGQADAATFTDGTPDVTLTLTPVNDAPTLTSTDGVTISYLEGGAAASGLFASTAISAIEAADTITGLVITVTGLQDGSSEVLNFDGEAIKLVNGANDGTSANFSYTVSFSGSTATVTFTGGTVATAATQTLIDGITYASTTDDPTTGTRAVTVTSITDSGGATTTLSGISSSVTVEGVNDAPAVTVATSTNPVFTEGDSAKTLFTGSGVTLGESGQTVKSFTITITNVTDGVDSNGDPKAGAAEFITLDSKVIALVAGTGTTTVNGLSYTITASGGTVTIVATGSESNLVMQSIIDNLAYSNTSGDPTDANRVVTLTEIVDNGGVTDGGVDTTALSIASTVDVEFVNTAPILTGAPSSVSVDEGGTVNIFVSDLKVTDPDTAAATSLTLTLTTGNTSASLTAAAAGTGSGITISGSGTNTLTLQGNAVDLSNYLSIATNVKYTGQTNNSTADKITIQTTDGGATNTKAAEIPVNFTGVEDAPTISFAGTTTVTLTEDTAGNMLPSDITISDVDTASNKDLSITFTATDTGATLRATTAGGVVVTQVNDYTVTLTGTKAELDNYLDTADNYIKYTGDTNANGTAADTIKISTSDNEGGTDTAAGEITINLNNKADNPTFTGKAYIATVPNGTTNPAGTTVSALYATKFTDLDGDNFAGIAIAGNHSETADGTWQYSKDGGATWTDIGAVSKNSALTLDLNDLVRFLPASDLSGTVGALEVYAIDNSDPTGSIYTNLLANQNADISEAPTDVSTIAYVLGYGSSSGFVTDPNAELPTPPSTPTPDAIQELGNGGETTTGTTGSDSITGGAGDDFIWAGAGDSGNDTIKGGSGNDEIAGGAGDDLLEGGSGIDKIYGGSGNDTLYGGGEFDGDGTGNQLWGGSGSDQVNGDGGSDTMGGGLGSDTLNGGAGNDTMYGGKDSSADTLDGGSGNDLIFSGAGNDSISGGNGHDTIFNGAGTDTVNGGNGNDTIWGSGGDDMLTGGAGNDTFAFAATNGDDTITDFSVTLDTLNLSNTTTDFTDLASVQAAATAVVQGGVSGVLINTGGGDSVFLQGLLLTNLTTMTFVYE